MKRVGNKSAQLVRSASRRGKTANRFQFDITVESVQGTKAGLSYIVKWSRGVKVAATKPVAATKESSGKAGLAINQKISLMVTLYREDGRKFDPKDAKLALIAINPGKKQERTTAKMHFDLSAFAGVPSSSTQKVLKLSDKVSIRATIDSRFIKAGGGPGSAGASSALSGMTGVSGRSSDDDEGEDDDFDDLALDDVPEPEVFSTSSAKSKKAPPVGRSPGNVPQPKVALAIEPTSSSPVPSAVAEKFKSPSPPPPDSVGSKRVISPLARFKRDKSTANGADEMAKISRADDEAKIGRLSQRNDELMAELEGASQENRRLHDSYKQQVADLQALLDARSREVSDSASLKGALDASMSEMKTKNTQLERTAQHLRDELDAVKRSRDAANEKYKAMGAVEQKNRELSREVDRLTVALSAGKSTYESDAGAEIQKRFDEIRRERDALEAKVKAREAHTAQVRSTYEQLSEMYNDLRERSSAMESELDETKAKLERKKHNTEDGEDAQNSELEEVRRELQDAEDSKKSLQSDHDRLLNQVTSLQERLDATSQRLEEAQTLTEDLYGEIEELKGQRDVAMQRALSRGKSGVGSESSSTKSLGKGEEETRASTEKYERESARLMKRIGELETEVSELREDVEYEKAEKMKAREDRDKIRENARELERKTSQAAKQSDTMQSLQRQISAHVMKEQDHESMIAELRAEVERLEGELVSARSAPARSVPSGGDDLGEVLQDLVSTKLALAQAEDEKLNLQFSMKTLKKSEKAIQQRLAAHASRLEVKLGEANEELERLRKHQQLEDAREFNELGSDVYY